MCIHTYIYIYCEAMQRCGSLSPRCFLFPSFLLVALLGLCTVTPCPMQWAHAPFGTTGLLVSSGYCSSTIATSKWHLAEGIPV